MNRSRMLGLGLRGLRRGAPGARSYVTDADIDKARKYCLSQLRQGDYDAYLIRQFVPKRVAGAYDALRNLNLELVRLPESISNPVIGQLRVQFWKDSIDNTFAGKPPREPICILLGQALRGLDSRGAGSAKGSIKFWIQRLIKTREKYMDNRPYPSLAALEEYAENTYSTLMYATLAMMPLRSLQVDHLASHIGKAAGIAAVLRGIPILSTPPQPVRSPAGADVSGRREPVLLLPLDVMAETGLKEEDVFRLGPSAPGLQDAVFKVATRANDHLITAREMLQSLQAGRDADHAFEHEGEAEHIYEEEQDAVTDIRRSFGVLLEAVPVQEYLSMLESKDFNPYEVRSSWKLPWRMWQALRKQRI